MSASYATWDRFRHLRLDGVSYDIGVRQRDDGRYLVSWICLECFEQGPLSPAADSIEHAVELGEVSLHIHHGLAHSDANGSTAHYATRLEVDELFDDSAEVGVTISRARELARPQYERARKRFEELRAAQSRVCLYVTSAKIGDFDSHEMYAACRQYRHAADEFSDALVGLSNALEARSKELERKIRGLKTPSLRRGTDCEPE